MKKGFAALDASAYLDSEEMIAEYLSAAAEDPDPRVFIAALGHVAKARGMTEVARQAGVGRESLYKALNGETNPRFETINAVMNALGVRFAVSTKPADQA